MSVLIDKLMVENDIGCDTKINGVWYMACPLRLSSISLKLSRFTDAIRIIKGTSFAVHYKEKE